VDIMILLHGNGYKALAVTRGDDDLQLVVAELRARWRASEKVTSMSR